MLFRSIPSQNAAKRLIRQPLTLTLIAIVALGAVGFYASSISVYSRGWIAGGEAAVGSSMTGPSEAGRAPSIADPRASSRDFAKSFSGKRVGSTKAPGEFRLNHRPGMGVFANSLLLPSITATKTDALFNDVNGNFIANPGDTIKYTVTITNSGSTDATGVTFSDTPDANTTVVPGSVSTTPVAIDDSYTATGNIQISVPAPGVLGNDSDADLNTLTASSGATSTNGGNVVVNANGSFTYNPAPGFEGTDTFNYTIADGTGNTDGGTVTITVSGMIWFVNAAAAPGGDGRLTSPYNCLTGAGCFFPAAPDGPGDNIFLYSGAYTGGTTLLANEKFIGQGASMPLASIAGITLAPNSDPLPSTGGANPVITTVAAATNGLTLGSGNLLRGFTVGNTTGAGISGSGFGNLTVREVLVNGTGQALSLSSGTLDADFGQLESLSSTTTGITLSSVSGDLTSGSTNIQNSSGIGISVSTLGTGTTGVDFKNTVVNGTNNTGVSLVNNTGNVTFADLDISPLNTRSGLVATNSVAVPVPGTIKTTSGTISTTNAIAVSITGATAALRTPVNITLDSVSDINTAAIAAGISLTNTTDGGFKVTGSGTTAGSGGTIQLTQQGAVFLAATNITLKNMNFINANTLDGGLTCTSTNVTNCKGAINLNTVAGVTIDNLFMDRTVATAGTEYGIFGRLVSDLTINNSTIQNQGDGNTEGVMRFSNLTGTSAFTNSTFKFASFKVVDIVNDSGTLNLAVTGSTFSDTQTSGVGADGLSVRAQTTANATVNVVNSTFLRLRTVGVSAFSANTAVANVNITGSSFDPVAPGLSRAVDLSSQGTSTLNFNVNNNPKVWANGGTAVNIFAVDSSVAQGRINNNPDIRGVVTSPGSGIVTQVNNTATLTVEIIGNTISNIGNGKGIQALGTNGTGSGARIDATITNNNVSVSAAAQSDIDIQAGNVATADINTVCANIRSNAASAGSGVAFRETTGSPGGTVLLEGFTVNATTTWNLNLNTPLNSVTESNAGTLGGGTCNVPSNPTALNYRTKPESNLALNAPAANTATWPRMLSAGVNSGLVRKTAVAATSVKPVRATTGSEAVAQNRHRSVRETRPRVQNSAPAMMHHASIARAVSFAPSMVGSVNLNIGTIPAGETVTITFNVTINSPLVPTNTTQVANQGTVSGTNFGPVVTDDPDTPAPNDPTITPVVNPNNPPDAVDDNATVAEDSGANTINVLANDTTAPDTGETLTITAVTQGANGAVAITGGGTTVSYTPNANFFGSDSFTYTINDGNGGTDTATVFVTVTNVNDNPDAVNDSATVAEDSGANAINVLANDSIAPDTGETLTITAVTQGGNGSVAITGGGTGLTYTPNANYFGPDSFTYTISDGNGGTDTATVSITVTNINDNPDAVNDNATVAEDSGANTINVLANDTAAPDTGETLTITAVTQGANGSVAITGGGTTVSYTPNANYFGPDSFTYTISDGNGGTDTAMVSVTVTNVNDNPDAVNDSATVAEDSGANAINVLANDTSAPDAGETLTITAVTQGANGSVAITGGGTGLTYTPNANYFGPDAFTYTISDGNGGTDTATVSVTVTSVNDNPDAVNDSATVVEDSGANAINVLANDTSAPDPGETLTIISVTQGGNGSVAITGGGTGLTYTPNANYFGPDSFTYTISDGNGGTDTATVSVTVTNVNDNPDAVNDSATVAEDSGANAINVLANDTAAPDTGETLTITAVTQGANGSVAITGGGTGLTYTPNANYFGPDSFTYTISDGNGGTDTATVSVTVTNVNDNPDAVNDSATMAEDSGANAINVLANDTAAPDTGETLTITAVTQGANGSVAITGGGTGLTYTPNANYFGPDSFTYTISDGNGGTDTATVSITVTPVNDPPVANAGPDQTVGCTAGVVTLNGTASFDVDDNSSTLVFVWKEGATTIATGPNPTVVLPVGTHTITLTVTDPHGASSQDTVVITVVDDSLPVITLTGTQVTLWPPNHQYATVNLTTLVASASDSCDPTVDLSDVVISKVTSDEVENGNGDGNTLNDIVIAADCKSVQLRSERDGSADGRVYTIFFSVKDTAGNVTTVSTKVTVPKSQNGSPAVDSGPHYTVNGTCP
jgi:hypothetical protein